MSSWWHIKLKCLKCKGVPCTWGPAVLLWSSSCFQINFIASIIVWTTTSDRKGCYFVIKNLSHKPTAHITPIVNVRGVILFLKEKAHHTWLTKLPNNAVACLRWLWLWRAVGSLPPPHYKNRKGLLHNLRPGCLVSAIKGIKLGRLDLFLPISSAAEQTMSQTHSTMQTFILTTSETGQFAVKSSFKTHPPQQLSSVRRRE